MIAITENATAATTNIAANEMNLSGNTKYDIGKKSTPINIG